MIPENHQGCEQQGANDASAELETINDHGESQTERHFQNGRHDREQKGLIKHLPEFGAAEQIEIVARADKIELHTPVPVEKTEDKGKNRWIKRGDYEDQDRRRDQIIGEVLAAEDGHTGDPLNSLQPNRLRSSDRRNGTERVSHRLTPT